MQRHTKVLKVIKTTSYSLFVFYLQKRAKKAHIFILSANSGKHHSSKEPECEEE
jgi:hypothetical protein